ncbi:hypothetical protein [Pontibacter anaerobius]|uniref:Uncharacterized protein n=1 Tax=Pontibacter anaerobius TaxID=2993940 RepID=A0ABT3RIV3_9BACT|nr:hypothetical protein [Pontibacter anaerobius]MCX2741782.1 hypothetical protein [Pontibacter anaerobius]
MYIVIGVDLINSAHNADKRHSDFYTVVGRDWDYFQVLKWRVFQAFLGLGGIKGH